jgi:hypothetical protein
MSLVRKISCSTFVLLFAWWVLIPNCSTAIAQPNQWLWFDPGFHQGQAQGWDLGEILMISVDDPATPQNPDWVGDTSLDPPDPDAHNLRTREFKVMAGFTITVSGPIESGEEVSRTLVVHDLLVGADFENNIVYGYAGSGNEVCVEAFNPGGIWCTNWLCVPVDISGYWEVDFTGVPCADGTESPPMVDLNPGQMITVHQWEEDGDSTALHWMSTVVPSVRCVGFDAPLASYPVKVRGNRALPLKARLFDIAGAEINDLNIITPPALEVWFSESETGEASNVTEDALPVGKGHDGNLFVCDQGIWRFNLKTSNYTAPGTYTVSMRSGDTSEYLIYSYSTCRMQFVIE